MAAAETLTLAHRIDANMESVGNEVTLINKSQLFFISPAPECVLRHTRLGVMEATAEIRLTFKHVSDLNRL